MPRDEPGPLPQLAWLPIDRLDVDRSYQRSLDTPAGKRLVASIATEFDWRKFGAVTTTPNSETEGRWWLIDGQHRTAGARLRGGVPELPALVYPALDVAAQAAAFVGANKDRVTVSAQALFHARLVAGDPEAAVVKRLCDAAGIRLLRSNLAARQMPAGSTAAVPALLRVVRVHGEAIAVDTFQVLGECLGDIQGGLRGPYFLVAARFLAEDGGTAGLRLALRRLGPDGLAAAVCGTGGQSGAAALAAKLREAVGIAAPATMTRKVAAARKDASRDVPAGASWAFVEHRSQAEIPVSAPPPPSTASADRDAIDRYLAEKGATHVLSLEQAAEYLREHEIAASVHEEQAEKGSNDSTQVSIVQCYRIGGKSVPIERFFAAVNEKRSEEGLPPAALPPKPAKRKWGQESAARKPLAGVST